MRVALIGLGVMGHGMAQQILAHGHALSVYNRSRDRAADLEAAGARVAATPRDVALDAEVLVTVVSNDAALRGVAEGPDGFIVGIAVGVVVLQMSTVGPDTTAWLDGEVQRRGGEMVDAPLLGSKPEAESGMLWVLAGGNDASIERARPVLDSVSQTVYHVGAMGQGTRLKLCNNLIVAGVVAAVAEGIALLEAGGVDPQQYIHILKDTNMPSRVWPGKATQMAAGDFAPRFSLDNMAKDVGLAMAFASSLGLELAQAAATRATLQRGAAAVGGDKDMAAAVEGARRHRPAATTDR